MSAPSVSIIVPVYNSGAFLMDCLETIVGQTMSDFEVLLVDDGSTDDSLAICRRFERHDSRSGCSLKKMPGQPLRAILRLLTRVANGLCSSILTI